MSGPGTNTGHGHVWPRPDGAKARCGGPGICRVCSADQAQHQPPAPPCHRPPAGWHCTLNAGHDGPCPTVADTPEPPAALVDRYAAAVVGIERILLGRAPRWTRRAVGRLTDDEVDEIAHLLAAAHPTR
ncbi:MAG TPA: hypothetical protein VKA83_22230 [Methylomirabilota bacterium]|nr:hypothetical protein [Methylomirabilota bacterium]